MDRPGAVTLVRAAVGAFAAAHGGQRWCVALSGGADSLALTAAAATLRPTVALIVDHGLQPDSADVARHARQQALDLGCVAAHVLTVDVGTEGGPEAAARAARYRALDEARAGLPVLLAHTLDDQAETVVLGLGRGSGARSIAGMRDYDAPWGRPLLAVRRTVTRAACAELGLRPWEDPHNTDPRFTRVRLRTEVLPLLEEVLGGGVAEALARTAAALREDSEALDALAAGATDEVRRGDGLDIAGLAGLPAAVRRRVIRRWLLDGGARDLTSAQIHRVDALVTEWRGQGGVAVPSAGRSSERRARLFASRRDGMLTMHTEPV
ncbi:tRNA lysidine(34) synthetase TilS [Mycolicibacterium sp. 120266]|uniref:tRNA lysidine(34) synthetase TilS n=1 Tax=Mycolicibacterium sp. 120266 TaxID=3090601 RepID=UPI00299D9DC0|nr:tRNA lysidine(34) synthetase TilS [Mycolicibacterium sp. 120266]MDX1871229.1 tRNA lysidine(34) synthetase TilS [Mycolicibacterium sp. 120266]